LGRLLRRRPGETPAEDSPVAVMAA